MVRDRIEEREERVLGTVSLQLEEARARRERLRVELASLREAGLQRPGALWTGAEIRERARKIADLTQREVEAVTEVERLEEQRAEQMQVYRGAHADRRGIEELQEQQRAARRAELLRQECKAGEELFLGRRTVLQQRSEQERTTR